MKNFYLRELHLWSHKEKRAIGVNFHPQMTVVKGNNNTGKSALLKSIFWILGAEPYTVHPNWKDAQVRGLLKFSLDEQFYYALRIDSRFSIFNNDQVITRQFGSVTKELGPYLASLFDFSLKLINRHTNQATIPPPAYQLIPFYIDQDGGWAKKWNSFDKLGQFSNWQSETIYYHLGITDAEYYKAQAELKILTHTIKGQNDEYSLIEKYLSKTLKKQAEQNFNLNLESYKIETDELIKIGTSLKTEQNKYRDSLSINEAVLSSLIRELTILQNAKIELEKDLSFMTRSDTHNIECPICGQEYDNSFVERFSIAKDLSACNEIISEVQKEIDKTRSKNKLIRESLLNLQSETSEITRLLSVKKDSLSLKDILTTEGRQAILVDLKDDLNEKAQEIHKNEVEQKRLSSLVRGYKTSSRANEIKKIYKKYMAAYLHELDVTSLEEKNYQKVDCKIKETGSDLPRALLAYNFSILSTMSHKDESTFFPIIIDSPNQQDQDDKNHLKILNFINNRRPKNSQTVLALVDAASMRFPGSEIMLTERDYLMRQGEYTDVAKYIASFEQEHFNFTIASMTQNHQG